MVLTLFTHLKFSAGHPVLEVAGDLDLATVGQLRKELDELIRQGHSRIILFLKEISFIDSTGLRFLMEAARDLRARGGKLDLQDPSPRVLRILGVTRLLDNFSIILTRRD